MAGSMTEGGPGGLRAWSSDARELADRVQFNLAQAILEGGSEDKLAHAVALLDSLARTANSTRTRLRAADLLLTHAERVAVMHKAQSVTNVDARTQTAVVTTLDRATLDKLMSEPTTRTASLNMLSDVAKNGRAGHHEPDPR